jgi:hypothetical protein
MQVREVYAKCSDTSGEMVEKSLSFHMIIEWRLRVDN